MGLSKMDLKATEPSNKTKKHKKKRAASSDLDLPPSGSTADAEAIDELRVDDDLKEPTMGEKLASLNLLEDEKAKIHEKEKSPPSTKAPKADSIHVLLKQALHADDHSLLLNCLFTQDEKVIVNSISLLTPSDVIKLLHSLIPIVQSRGAVAVCALPWLRNLLLQHASSIMSQESSLVDLNSLYQLIESRVSTFRSALQLASCLDYLFTGVFDDEGDETRKIAHVVFQDNDDSSEDEQEPEDDQDGEEELEENGVNYSEGSDDMSE